MAKNLNKQEPEAIPAQTQPDVTDQDIVSTVLLPNENEAADSANETEVAEANPNFDGCFEYDGKKYRVRLPKVHIPGLGERTALELAVDSEAQQWLIKNNCIGSVIEEVID